MTPAVSASAMAGVDRSDEFLANLQALFTGKLLIPQSLFPHIDIQFFLQAQTQYAHFTRREREIFLLVCIGLSSTSICERLHISPHTVRRHRAAICEKLGVSGHNCLSRYALEFRHMVTVLLESVKRIAAVR